MTISQEQMESIFNQGASFIDLLNFIDYQDDVYYLADGSLGKVWKVDLVSCEGKNEEYLSSLSKSIEQFVLRVPEGDIAAPFIIQVSNNIQEKRNEYELFNEGKSVNNLFTQSKLDYLMDKSRKIELLLTLRYFPRWPHKTFLGGKVDVEQLMVEHVEDFRKIMLQIEHILDVAQIKYVEVDSAYLINYLYQVLNPKRSSIIPTLEIRNDISLREQVLFNEPQFSGSGFCFEDSVMNIISLKELPGETMPGMFTRELYEGIRYCLLDSVPSMLFVINLTVPPMSESINRLNWHKSFSFMHQDNWLGDKSIEVLEKKKELDSTIARLYREGERIVHARFHVVVFEKNVDKLQESTDTLINTLSRLGCDAFIETIIGASLFLTCLPLGFDPYFEKYIKRVKRLTSPNIADMLPIYGSFLGTTTPASIYLNRRGEMVFLDLFDSNINPHAVVVGASGAGKSFFMNDFILQHKRLGAHFLY